MATEILHDLSTRIIPTWTIYIPPSQITWSLLKKTNEIEQYLQNKFLSSPFDVEEHLQEMETMESTLSNQTSLPRKKRRKSFEIDKPFVCHFPYCMKKYGSSGALKTHIRRKHSNRSSEERDDENSPNSFLCFNTNQKVFSFF